MHLLTPRCTFVIASSGSVAEKTGDKMEDYNNAAFLARDGAVAYNDAKGTSCANLAEVRGRRSTEYPTHRLPPPLCVRDGESRRIRCAGHSSGAPGWFEGREGRHH
jgi:hypothetical protein